MRREREWNKKTVQDKSKHVGNNNKIKNEKKKETKERSRNVYLLLMLSCFSVNKFYSIYSTKLNVHSISFHVHMCKYINYKSTVEILCVTYCETWWNEYFKYIHGIRWRINKKKRKIKMISLYILLMYA